MLFKSKILLTLVIILSISCLYDPKVFGSELNFAGQASKDASVIGNSAAGASAGAVSLYTGQHAEVFPLVTLPTQGLGEINFTLSYTGNVSQVAKKENRLMPSSWVGLGFSLGIEYISCDHKGTLSIADDEYYYVGSSGESFKLLTNDPSSNVYFPSSGNLWRLERNTAVINSKTYTVGWTVIKDNGVRFIFGDNSTDFSTRNATWFQLHWDESVQIATTNGDLPIPIRWDIARVERNANAYITYEYEQINDFLTVINSPSNRTDNEYTQSSYPKKISSSNGYAVEFILTDRLDFQDRYNSAYYEYYRTKKLSSLITKYNDNETSHIRFQYDYLNKNENNIWKKLILKSIQTFDGANVNGLPPVEFTYFDEPTSPFFGSIQFIHYAEGGIKEIVYEQISADNTLMKLDEGGRVLFDDRPKYAYSANTMIRKYRLEGQSEWHYDIGAFNGYWLWETLDDITDSHGDSSVTAGDNWVALYNHDINKYIIFEWMSGGWKRDTIAVTWSNPVQYLEATTNPGGEIDSDEFTATHSGVVTYSLEVNGSFEKTAYSYAKLLIDDVVVAKADGSGYEKITGQVDVSANQVVKVVTYAPLAAASASIASASIYLDDSPENNIRLDAGNDYFIAFDVKEASPMELVRRAYFYKKTENGWVEHLIFDQGNYNDSLKSVSLGMDMFVVQIEDHYDQEKSKLIYGKYEHETNSIISASSNWLDNLIYDVSMDLVTWGRQSRSSYGIDVYVHIAKYSNQSWSDDVIIANALRDLIAIEEGVVFTDGWYDIVSGKASGECAYLFQENGAWQYRSWYIGFHPVSTVFKPLSKSPSGKMFSLHRQVINYNVSTHYIHQDQDYTKDILIFEWNGSSWDSTALISDTWNNMEVLLSHESVIAYHPPYNSEHTNGELFVRKRRNDNTWSGLTQLYNDAWTIYYQTMGATFGSAKYQFAGDNLLVAYFDGTVRKNKLHKWDSKNETWSTIDMVPYSSDPTSADSAWYTNQILYNGRFFLRERGERPEYLDRSFYTFQEYNDTYFGVPTFSVVKHIKMYSEGEATSIPLVVDYSYDGGILDEAGNTPRFAKVMQSTVYYDDGVDAPKGYTISNFYNDLDNDNFNDPHGDGTLLLPDLDDASFGLKNGGYLLDGIVYNVYDSSVVESYPELPHNSTTNFYSLQKFSDHPDAGLRVLLDSTKSIEDGVEQIVKNTYDALGRLTKTETPMYDDFVMITETEYAIFDQSINDYTKPSESSKRIESATETEWINRNKSFWVYQNGEVQLTKKVSWPDASVDVLDGSEIVTFEEITTLPNNGRDEYGNLVCWQNIDNDTSSAKYSSDGRKLIASVSNGFSNNVFLYNAEEDFDATAKGYDGWVNSTPSLNDNTSVVSFTGNRSFKIVDDPNSSGSNFGLERYLYPDSVVRNQYILSFWAKSNGPVKGAISIKITDMLPLSIVTNEHTGNNEWQLLTCILDLTDVQRANLEYIQIFIGSINYPNLYGYIDDVRFHPVDAIINTREVSPLTGLITSTSGNDNIPKRKERDEFNRTTAVKNYKNQLLSETEYYNSRQMVQIPDNINAIIDETQSVTPVTVAMTSNQTVSYYLELDDDEYAWNFFGKAYVYKDGVAIDSLVSDDYTFNAVKTGTFSVEAGDLVTVDVSVYTDSYFSFKVQAKVDFVNVMYDEYDPAMPNYTKNTSYHPGTSPVVTVSYKNGMGELLQTRKQVDYNGQIATRVSGLSSKNAIGQIEKSYLSYIDTWGETDVLSFEDSLTYKSELNNFYDGVNEIDMDTFTYAEFVFEDNLQSRLVQSSGTGADFSISSGHILSTEYIEDVIGTDTVSIIKSTNPDGITSASRMHKRGKYSAKISYYTKNLQQDSIVNMSYQDIMQQINLSTIDTGSGEIVLRRSYTNDRGLADSTWKVDYGTTRILYDNNGKVRFVQDTIQFIGNKCIYYKYDNHGRKIEEGILENATSVMNQQNANNTSFPTVSDNPSVQYKWFYDYYKSTSIVDPFNNHNYILSPGNLVRVQSGDGLYYKNYISDPLAYWDAVVVKLPLLNSSEKAIRHYYNYDGSLKRYEIYPHFPDSSDARAFSFTYDFSRRVKTLEEVPVDSNLIALETRKHIEYFYRSNNAIDYILYGVYERGSINKIVQKVDYTYDSRGMLVKINDPDLPEGSGGIVNNPEGGVTATSENDHFGELITYYDDVNGYFDGKIFKTKTINSLSPTSNTTHEYEYLYNDLGWLIDANHTLDISKSRKYAYNALGARDTLVYDVANNFFTKYNYETNGDPGSCRLINTSDMGSFPDITYDEAGNMTSDSSRVLRYQSYDYRHLLAYSRIAESSSGLQPSSLYFGYDESGMRIKKVFKYYYWQLCDNDIPIAKIAYSASPNSSPIKTKSVALPSEDSDAHTIGGDYCPRAAYNEKYYLYDGGILVATFDKNDNTKELFINSNGNMVASYGNNDNSKLYYFLKDHLGSTRAIIHDRELDVPVVVQANSYFPYGEIMDSWSSIENEFKYTGKERDLHYNFDFTYFGARYYDAKLARFTSLDQASEFVNGYSYVGNNPISLMDPDGNAVGPVILAIAKAWGYIQLAKTGYNLMYTLANFMENPSVSGFAMMATSFGEGYILSQAKGLKGLGVTVAWNKAVHDQWPTRDQYIEFGLTVGYYIADYYDEWRFRVGFKKRVGFDPREIWVTRRMYESLDKPTPPPDPKYIFAAWFEDENSGTIFWLSPFPGDEFLPGYMGDILYDAYGDYIDPMQVENQAIVDYTDEFNRVSKSILDQAADMIGIYDYEAARDFWTNEGIGDLKRTKPFINNRYYIVNGSIYKSQDLGNYTFGIWVSTEPLSIPILIPQFNAFFSVKAPNMAYLLGGGYAQYWANYELFNQRHSAAIFNFIWNIPTFGDDRRGSYYVKRGINNEGM